MPNDSASRKSPRSQIWLLIQNSALMGSQTIPKMVLLKHYPFPFSLSTKQILNPGYFLWKIEFQDLNCMKFICIKYFTLANDLYIYNISLYLPCNDRMTIASLIEMETI